jgi:hypothetical protein
MKHHVLAKMAIPSPPKLLPLLAVVVLIGSLFEAERRMKTLPVYP